MEPTAAQSPPSPRKRQRVASDTIFHEVRAQLWRAALCQLQFAIVESTFPVKGRDPNTFGGRAIVVNVDPHSAALPGMTTITPDVLMKYAKNPEGLYMWAKAAAKSSMDTQEYVMHDMVHGRRHRGQKREDRIMQRHKVFFLSFKHAGPAGWTCGPIRTASAKEVTLRQLQKDPQAAWRNTALPPPQRGAVLVGRMVPNANTSKPCGFTYEAWSDGGMPLLVASSMIRHGYDTAMWDQLLALTRQPEVLPCRDDVEVLLTAVLQGQDGIQSLLQRLPSPRCSSRLPQFLQDIALHFAQEDPAFCAAVAAATNTSDASLRISPDDNFVTSLAAPCLASSPPPPPPPSRAQAASSILARLNVRLPSEYDPENPGEGEETPHRDSPPFMSRSDTPPLTFSCHSPLSNK